MKQSGLYLFKPNLNVSVVETQQNKRVLYVNVNVGVVRSNVMSGTKVQLFTKKYVLDTQIRENYFELIWKNEFGVFDSFKFEGIIQEETKNDRNVFEESRNLNAGYIGDSSIKDIYKIDSKKEFVVNSGLLYKEQAEWLNYIGRSLEVYYKTTHNNIEVLRKVFIVDTKLKTNTQNSLFNVEVSFEEEIITKNK
jgi:hypothetical protein